MGLGARWKKRGSWTCIIPASSSAAPSRSARRHSRVPFSAAKTPEHEPSPAERRPVGAEAEPVGAEPRRAGQLPAERAELRRAGAMGGAAAGAGRAPGVAMQVQDTGRRAARQIQPPSWRSAPPVWRACVPWIGPCAGPWIGTKGAGGTVAAGRRGGRPASSPRPPRADAGGRRAPRRADGAPFPPGA